MRKKHEQRIAATAKRRAKALISEDAVRFAMRDWIQEIILPVIYSNKSTQQAKDQAIRVIVLAIERHLVSHWDLHWFSVKT